MKHHIDFRYDENDYKKEFKTKELKIWIEKIFDRLNFKNIELSVFFCNNQTMQELNLQYRNKNSVTDVLSFPQMEDGFESGGFLGDSVICIPQAKLQSETQQHDLKTEVEFLLLHSILHLCGYDHETDQGEMDELQRKIYQELTGVILEE